MTVLYTLDVSPMRELSGYDDDQHNNTFFEDQPEDLKVYLAWALTIPSVLFQIYVVMCFKNLLEHVRD